MTVDIKDMSWSHVPSVLRGLHHRAMSKLAEGTSAHPSPTMSRKAVRKKGERAPELTSESLIFFWGTGFSSIDPHAEKMHMSTRMNAQGRTDHSLFSFVSGPWQVLNGRCRGGG